MTQMFHADNLAGLTPGEILRSRTGDSLPAGMVEGDWEISSDHYTAIASEIAAEEVVEVLIPAKAPSRKPSVFYPSQSRIVVDGSILPVTPGDLDVAVPSHREGLAVMHGLFLHELAHLMFTRWVSKDFDGISASIASALEDIRVEHKMVSKRPAARQWLRAAAPLHITEAGTTKSAVVALPTLLLAVEGLGRALVGVLTPTDVTYLLPALEAAFSAEALDELAEVVSLVKVVGDSDAKTMLDLTARLRLLIEPAAPEGLAADSDSEDTSKDSSESADSSSTSEPGDEDSSKGEKSSGDDKSDEKSSSVSEEPDGGESSEGEESPKSGKPDNSSEASEEDADEKGSSTSGDSEGGDPEEADSSKGDPSEESETSQGEEGSRGEEGSEGEDGSSEGDSSAKGQGSTGAPSTGDPGSVSGSGGGSPDGDVSDDSDGGEGGGDGAGSGSSSSGSGSEGASSGGTSKGSSAGGALDKESSSASSKDGSETKSSESTEKSSMTGESTEGSNASESSNAEGSTSPGAGSSSSKEVPEALKRDSGVMKDAATGSADHSSPVGATGSEAPYEGSATSREALLSGLSMDEIKSLAASFSKVTASAAGALMGPSSSISDAEAEPLVDALREKMKKVRAPKKEKTRSTAIEDYDDGDEDSFDDDLEDMAGSHGFGYGGGLYHSTRLPKSKERSLRTSLTARLRRAQWRDRSMTEVSSLLPPGRLSSRELVRGAAERSLGKRSTSRPWRSKHHKVVETPKLRVAVLCDVSGSMSGVVAAVASSMWVTASSVVDSGGSSVGIAFGDEADIIVDKSYRTPEKVTTYPANGGMEAIYDALILADERLDLHNRRSPGNAPRIVVIISDGHWVDPAQSRAANSELRKLKASGAKIIHVGVGSLPASHPGTVTTVLKNASEIDRVIGEACLKALKEA